MMLPSAAPMVLTHRKIADRKGLLLDGLFFVGGYLVVWGSFSAVATVLQWWLQQVGQLSQMLITTENITAGVILIAAGVYQWTPLKDLCLAKCRTPIGFLTTEWREGPRGALSMGLRHGAYCVGCCWALMALLFAFGVMNLAAIGFLSCMVAAEKLLPRGEAIARIGGVGLTIWGAWLLVPPP